jgi:O-succinylbenzoic acid--CoA ligase
MVAVLAGNSGAYVRVVHAIARLGAVLLPLNIRLAPAELAFQVQDAGASMVIADHERLDVAKALRLPVASLQDVTKPSTMPELFQAPPFVLGETISVLYTSGTTGRPKGAIQTFGNHYWSATASNLNLGTNEDDRWLAALPLFHVGGLSILLRSVLFGMTAVVHESFDPARANAAIDDGVTVMSVVANMLQRMLDERGECPYPFHLRCMLLGGGPAAQPLLEACAARGVPVVQTYGLTETASQLTTLAPADALRKLGSAGKALSGSEVRIVGEDGRDCAANGPGEIIARGPTVTPGYLNRPEATAEALRDGWLHTGDLGYLDAEGYLYVLDRRTDLIVSGGENVYPAEIESALQSHPAVLEAGVIGVADDRWGQVPHAVVVLRPGAATTAGELIEWCKAHLASYKTPRGVSFVESLPRNAAGKLVRASLKP